jgi:hypothetical protein
MIIKTIKENEHEVLLSNLELIQLNQIIHKVEVFSGTILNVYQLNLHSMASDAIAKHPHLANDYLKTMGFFNELLLFVGSNGSNARNFSSVISPVSDGLG